MYHVLNRAVARLAALRRRCLTTTPFWMSSARRSNSIPRFLLAYCVMPNHWHLVLWPRHDSELTNFVRWLTHTHAMRWHAHFGTSGSGHLYQGRFKSFPVETDEHF
ncbi:MAG: transposase [Planctomycetaceae bacterium]